MEKKKPAVKIKSDIYWAQLNKMNELSNAYQVCLCNLSDAAAAALEDLGIGVVENEKRPEMGKYILCKSKNRPIRAFDVDGDEILENIGNTSKAKALVTPYEWVWKGKKGISPSIVKLVVTDLVEYAGAEGISADDEDVL